ncbi:hypothetical protein C8Q78DRAFT_1083289 [Trametes maxima]|nr:hypothetical protein C8Q78DRAFT_1083289 [Trametes maxima]
MEHRLSVMANIVASTFISDVKTFVSASINKETQDILQDPTHELYDWSRARKRSLKQWLKYPDPLNYGTQKLIYADLVRAISQEEQLMANGLPPSSRATWSIEAFVDHIYKWAKSSTISPRSPLYKDGSTGTVLRTIIHESCRVLRAHSQEDRDSELKLALVRALTAKHIHFVPDALPNPLGHGSPSHQPSIHAWTVLGDAPDANSLDASLARTHGEKITLQLLKSANVLANNDVRADWTLDHLPT